VASGSITTAALCKPQVVKIAYFCCSREHLALGALSIQSARAAMPQAEIVHLTDEATPALEGADVVLRQPLEGNWWRRMWHASAALEGDVIHANTDIVFRADVSHVFALDFDIAVPHIADPVVRYDAGLLFCRRRSFCRRLADAPAAEAPEGDIDAWLAAYNTEVDSARWWRVVLPGHIYSHVPLTEETARLATYARALHYRGPRKRWLLPTWKTAKEGAWAASC